MSIQPQWTTRAGSLGTIPEGVFYQIPVQAVANDNTVFYTVVAGELPTGIQITPSGVIEGVPRNVLIVQGAPSQVSEDVTSKFAIRAFTTKTVAGQTVVDRINDQTFTITVTGQDIPEFITAPGRLGTFIDGSRVSVQIQFADKDIDDTVTIRVVSGRLPPGLALNPRTGLISGIIQPLVGPPGTAPAGYDLTAFDQFPWDYRTVSVSTNFQFALEITDGKDSDIRTFEIFVFAVSDFVASNDNITADSTVITADGSPVRAPVLITDPGSLGTIRSDNYFAFKFNGVDFDGDPFVYELITGDGPGFDVTAYDAEEFDRGIFSAPPGLILNSATGWLSGYIPDQGPVEDTYQFGIRLRKQNLPDIASSVDTFTIKMVGSVDGAVAWITGSDLGSIDNGAVSTLSIAAQDAAGRSLQYRLSPGAGNRLPQGLTLLPSGNIVGRASFNTFAIDSGVTTFDVNSRTRGVVVKTTFDKTFEFTANAYAPATEQPTFRVDTLVITQGGAGYTNPVAVFSDPPAVQGAVTAKAGAVTVVNGVITRIELFNAGNGYTAPPTVTVTDSTGSGAVVQAKVGIIGLRNIISIFRQFKITVNRQFDQPYQDLYIKAMPPDEDRAVLGQLLQNQDIIPQRDLYRADDPSFGVAKSVRYNHAFGLRTRELADYVAALEENHYWKNLVLGQVDWAQARDASGVVIYEVVYSGVVDSMLTGTGASVSQQITWPVPVNGTQITVYPNSLLNMRDQVFGTVGRINPILPLWMTSKQADGRVLGFTPAWVIAYVKPGTGARVAYNIQQKFGNRLNTIDFRADRYEIDRSASFAWDPVSQQWQPQPPQATVFNQDTTVFDVDSTVFVTPADTVTNTDQHDRYILYPQRDILTKLSTVDTATESVKSLDSDTVSFDSDALTFDNGSALDNTINTFDNSSSNFDSNALTFDNG